MLKLLKLNKMPFKKGNKFGELNKGQIPWNKNKNFTQREIINCKFCNKQIKAKITLNRKFCNQSCSIKYHNIGRKLTKEWKENIGKGVEKKSLIVKVKCQYCKTTFNKRLQNYQIIKNYTPQYCSRKCAIKSNSKRGPMTPETKKKLRLVAINNIKNKTGLRVNVGKNEKQLLNELELSNNIKIIRQLEILGYFVDGYCKKLNLVFEIDEKLKNRIRDIQREKEIKEELNCQFIRIKDY